MEFDSDSSLSPTVDSPVPLASLESDLMAEFEERLAAISAERESASTAMINRLYDWVIAYKKADKDFVDRHSACLQELLSANPEASETYPWAKPCGRVPEEEFFCKRGLVIKYYPANDSWASQNLTPAQRRLPLPCAAPSTKHQERLTTEGRQFDPAVTAVIPTATSDASPLSSVPSAEPSPPWPAKRRALSPSHVDTSSCRARQTHLMGVSQDLRSPTLNDLAPSPISLAKPSTSRRLYSAKPNNKRHQLTPPPSSTSGPGVPPGPRKAALVPCAFCRKRKVRCSRGFPCQRCEKSGVSCEYSEQAFQGALGNQPGR